MKIRKYRVKSTEDWTSDVTPKYIVSVQKVSETYDGEGRLINEEYEIVVLE